LIFHKNLDFLNFFEFLNFCDVRRKGWGYAHAWEIGVSMALYGDAATPRVFGVIKIPHTLLLCFIETLNKNVYGNYTQEGGYPAGYN
jgi:hypothetical protein